MLSAHSSSIMEERKSARRWVIRIPHRIDEGLLFEGVYLAALAGLLTMAFLRAPHREQLAVALIVLGACTLAGFAWLVRGIWLSFSERRLILGDDEIALERRLYGWKSIQRLATAGIREVVIRRSSGRRTPPTFFLEIAADRSCLRLGHDLTWEENFHLWTAAEQFLQICRPSRRSRSHEAHQSAFPRSARTTARAVEPCG